MRFRLALGLLLLAGTAWAEAGEAVFRTHCASCHSVAAGAAPGPAPHLAGLIGRRVAGDPGFGYSPVLLAAREAGQNWDRAMLERFLQDPEEMFAGLWMGGTSVRRPAEIEAVVRFLSGR